MPKLFCQVWGDSDAEPFPVKIDGGDTIGELKKLIIIEGPLSLRDMRAPNLKLWKWNKPDMVTDSDLDSNTVLNPMVKIEGIFKNDPHQEACVHIIIRTPERGSSKYLFSSSSDESLLPPGSVEDDTKGMSTQSVDQSIIYPFFHSSIFI
ncbi:hypothetical protein L211DRAFT_693746 [Terfezia boudieri ATCC MYA-4762]|uniref:Crinkler effector protein N-terminal domain-containing protein n=1 Tax=Terfezia boudieri ATCC MYA-4762 TaxID=1051890 RepID=A0A3N4M827_9PEZI|nr:hypothetical protein L211DRAFT_693746 [Terfezia boudieri ATCC MYA-4762]